MVGTIPAAGASAGRLTFLDPATGEYEVDTPPVPDAGVAALAYDATSGVLYGGAAGHAFAYDMASGSVRWTVDLAHGVVSALRLVQDGNLWALTSTGWLIRVDPAEPATISTVELFPGRGWNEEVDALLRHSRLLLMPDGFLYGATLGLLFRIDPARPDSAGQPETLAEDAYLLTADDSGVLYFARDTRLFAYNPA